jgi:hypothetical protein
MEVPSLKVAQCHTVTPLKMGPKLVTETSEVKTQTPGKFPDESTLESQYGESLKTYILDLYVHADAESKFHIPQVISNALYSVQAGHVQCFIN